MKLPLRLQTICDLVTDKNDIYDIGCDHGLLDIALTQKGFSCTATDLRPSALQQALTNFQKYHLEDQIALVCSDGFQNIVLQNPATVIIAGMGTHTILDILDNSQIVKIDTLIIQANNDLALLREKIANLGFMIVDEKCVFDQEIYYVIVKWQKGEITYSKKEQNYGPILMKQKSPVRDAYYMQKIRTNEMILQNIPSNHKQKTQALNQEIKELKELIKH